MNTLALLHATALASASLALPLDPPSRAASPAPNGSEWTPLFNGRDLSGWTPNLGPPSPYFDGFTFDTSRAFGVIEIDGEPAIRVHGAIWGALTTDEQYGDFELRCQFRWGGAIWPPLHFRDSGLMVCAVGREDAVAIGASGLDGPGPITADGQPGFFRESMEYQISRGNVGGYVSLGRVTVESVERHPVREREIGRWNTIEIEVLGDQARFFLNGVLVQHVKNARWVREDGAVPLTRGHIQLQSEGSEIYFRRIELRPIERFAEVARGADAVRRIDAGSAR